MSWIASAVAIGTTAYSAHEAGKGADRASAAADRSADLAHKLGMEELEFAQEQYDQWQSVFGPLQEQLSSYYQNLSPERIATQDLQAFQQETEGVLDQVRQTFEQRGIATSGLAGQAEIDWSKYTASQRAKIRADAPMKAAREKTAFLTADTNNPNAPLVSGALASQSNRAQGIERVTAQNVGTAYGAKQTARTELISRIGETAVDAYDYYKTRGEE